MKIILKLLIPFVEFDMLAFRVLSKKKKTFDQIHH